MNKYKICLIKNRYTGIIAINKYVVEWFKTYANLTVELNIIETDFDVTTMKANNATFSGVIPGLDIIDKLKTIIPENKYNAVVFLYGNDLNGIRVSSTNFMGANPLYPDTEIILTHIGDDQGRVINHEMFHCFFMKVKKLQYQFNVVDNMDSYIQNSNMLVDNVIDTNREVALQTLKPFWGQICAFRTQSTQPPPKPTQNNSNLSITPLYKPKNFTIKELVSPVIYARFGDKCWEFLDERMLRNLQFIRENLGAIIVNNSTYQYRCFDACEYRKDGVSQHNMGRACDFDVKGMTAESVRQWIIKNQDKLPEPNCWLEIGTSWVHLDCRYSDKKGVYSFNG